VELFALDELHDQVVRAEDLVRAKPTAGGEGHTTARRSLLLYPDHAWNIGGLNGYEYEPKTQRRERFLIAEPEEDRPLAGVRA